MKDRWVAYVPVLLLAGLAALTYWLDQVVEPEAARDGSVRHDPDVIIDGLAATKMALTGLPNYSVKARRMFHYPDDGSYKLEQPELTHFDPDAAPVSIRSDTGELSGDGNDVYFRDNVFLRRPAFDGDQEMTMSTSYLHVIPDKDTALTDKPVVLTQGDSVVHSVGLEFNNATRQLKLLSRVRGTYQTPQKGKPLPWDRRRQQ